MRWSAKTFLGLVVALVVLAIFGASYQVLATRRAERAFPPPGVLVDVGGHRLHINCLGRGNPTVVLDAALGNTSANWVWVQQQIAKTTRVCAYDRAGMGWSEPGPEPRDANRISAELHTVLGNAGLDGPYVLVGHSFGGLYARAYAAGYPDDVAGVVLVDSSHPDQFTRLPRGPEDYQSTRRLFTIAPLAARLGAVRVFNVNPAPATLPPQQRAQVRAVSSSTRHVAATADEFRATPETTAAARLAGGLGDKPLAVVSAGERAPGWLELQEELATLSTRSSHRVVEGSTHTSLLDNESHAQETSAAILEVVDAVRNGEPAQS